jgi:glucokinase
MKESPIVLVLDAGGTNLVFNAVQNGHVIGKPVILPARSENLSEFLEKLISGFKSVADLSPKNPSAISFCFPGPADYELGIIGDLENLPFFKGGVPLKSMLENKFKIPVYINNDGDLFALGEALGGLLAEINFVSNKKFKNLLGVTLGTGFGGGIVSNGRLFIGDNSAAGEINRMSNLFDPLKSVEETLSIRGIKRLFANKIGVDIFKAPEPYEIYQIGMGEKIGDKDAAVESWEEFATVLADAIANAATLVDGNVVIGGGLSGAYPLFLDKTVSLLNGNFKKNTGEAVPRMEVKVFNWHNKKDKEEFLNYNPKKISVPFSDEVIEWDGEKKIAIGVSKLGTSQAVALGAYHFAMNRI